MLSVGASARCAAHNPPEHLWQQMKECGLLTRFGKTFLTVWVEPTAKGVSALEFVLQQVMKWKIHPSRKNKQGSDPTATRNES